MSAKDKAKARAKARTQEANRRRAYEQMVDGMLAQGRFSLEPALLDGRRVGALLLLPYNPRRPPSRRERFARLEELTPAPAVDPRAGWRHVLDEHIPTAEWLAK